MDNGSFLCSWSGGKDSYYAFCKAVDSGLQPRVLFNALNEFGDKSRSHGIPKEVLLAQADCLNLPIDFITTSWADYEASFISKLNSLRLEHNFSHAIYGDIDIESHREWEEKVSKAALLVPVLPLWQQDRVTLVREMIQLGIKAIIVSCREEIAEHILGKVIDEELIQTFRDLGIDECGENGEYHTLVVDGPQHKKALEVKLGKVDKHKNYSFIELILK